MKLPSSASFSASLRTSSPSPSSKVDTTPPSSNLATPSALIIGTEDQSTHPVWLSFQNSYLEECFQHVFVAQRHSYLLLTTVCLLVVFSFCDFLLRSSTHQIEEGFASILRYTLSCILHMISIAHVLFACYFYPGISTWIVLFFARTYEFIQDHLISHRNAKKDDTIRSRPSTSFSSSSLPRSSSSSSSLSVTETSDLCYFVGFAVISIDLFLSLFALMLRFYSIYKLAKPTTSIDQSPQLQLATVREWQNDSEFLLCAFISAFTLVTQLSFLRFIHLAATIIPLTACCSVFFYLFSAVSSHALLLLFCAAINLIIWYARESSYRNEWALTQCVHDWNRYFELRAKKWELSQQEEV
eukprot:TRINITY_DN1321_c0_g1_i1.p1 TRINITY_DN1321_c0_g1~~TRINITY_DN1321_c0_g1_i1.p1  ORF type:complete len:375 (-),score=74.87 TRINITY_DN1321_c0_g1_i1:291-1358(-)